MQSSLNYTLNLVVKLFDGILASVHCFKNETVTLVSKSTEQNLHSDYQESISDFIIKYLDKKNSRKKLTDSPEFTSLKAQIGFNEFIISEIKTGNDSKKFYLLIFLKSKINSGKKEQLNKILEEFENLLNEENSVISEENSDCKNVLLQNGNDLIFFLDRNGLITYVNNSGALLLDYTVDEIRDEHFLKFVTENEKDNIGEYFNKILKTNETVSFIIGLESRYGKIIYFQMMSVPVVYNDKVEKVIGVGKNISEVINLKGKIKELNSKLIEAQRLMSIERDRVRQHISVLEELNRLKSDFVANISHELRTPLSSIIGFSETIASDPEMPEEMRDEFNEIILSEGKRLAKLINDILDISKIESKTLELEKKDFEVVSLLNNILDTFDKAVKKKDLTVNISLPDQPVIMYGDKEKIYQALNNIINNAVKFTEMNGRILIKAQLLNKEIEIIVSDTGIGIPEKDLPNIFQKFYRVNRTGNELPGTRLGLSLAKQIIDMHKGFIVVQSEENKGTTFIITLPVRTQTIK